MANPTVLPLQTDTPSAATPRVPAQVDIPVPAAGASFNFKAVLQRPIQQNASDVHLKVGRPPVLRVNGDLMTLELPPLKPEDLKSLAEQIMTPKQVKEFAEANLGSDWAEVRTSLAEIREAGYAVSYGEIEQDVIAIAAPNTRFPYPPKVQIDVGTPGIDHDSVAFAQNLRTFTAIEARQASDALQVADVLRLIDSNLDQTLMKGTEAC